MRKIKVAINGFGRVGRAFFRQAVREFSGLEVVAINDLMSPQNLFYLLNHDSVYGRPEKVFSLVGKSNDLLMTWSLDEDWLVNEKFIKLFHEKDPQKLPWQNLGIDVVVDATGIFDTYETLSTHLKAGAKRVVLTAPTKDPKVAMATINVGDEIWASSPITSNASCTTNATAPLIKVLGQTVGIQSAVINTIHAYTASQSLVDGPDRKDDFRRTRAAAVNISPSSTGAAKAVSKVVKELENKFDGIAVRVPVVAGSLLDLTFIARKPTTVQEITDILVRASVEDQWNGILGVTEDPLVSTDIIKDPRATIVDLAMTRVVDGDLVKILSWYDNEWGYCATLVRHVLKVAQYLD